MAHTTKFIMRTTLEWGSYRSFYQKKLLCSDTSPASLSLNLQKWEQQELSSSKNLELWIVSLSRLLFKATFRKNEKIKNSNLITTARWATLLEPLFCKTNTLENLMLLKDWQSNVRRRASKNSKNKKEKKVWTEVSLSGIKFLQRTHSTLPLWIIHKLISVPMVFKWSNIKMSE